MSDQKSEDTGPVKPQVIDLDAEEIKVEHEDIPSRLEAASAHADDLPPPPPPPPHQAGKKRRGTGSWIIAALAIGLLAGGWLYRDVLSTYLPTDEMAAMKTRLDVLDTNSKTANEQLLAVSQSAENASQAVASVDAAAKAAASGVAEVSARIDGFESRIASAEAALDATKSDLATLRNAVSAGGTSGGTGGADTAALAAIGQRIEALEKDVASLKSGSGSGDKASVTSALSQALADLKAKAASGTPFQTEYDRLARMVPAAPGLDVLASLASQGVPAPQALASELRAAIPALPQPQTPTAPAEQSYWDMLLGSLNGIITIRDIGEADWPQLAERAAAFADAGDLTQAIGVIDAAEGSKPTALVQWRDRAASRLRLEAAVNDVSEAVLRQITALGGAQ
jgi:hypothetical protein